MRGLNCYKLILPAIIITAMLLSGCSAVREPLIGYDFWAKLLVKGGDHEKAALDFLRRAKVEAKKRRDDSGAIRKLIDDLKSDDYETRRSAMYTLGSEHGPYSVPHFQTYLAEPTVGEFRISQQK